MIKNIKFGLTAGVVSIAVDGVAGLVNIHNILTTLSKGASGIWLLLLTAAGFFQIIQTSIAPVITRYIARNPRTGKTIEYSLEYLGIKTAVFKIQASIIALGFGVGIFYLPPIANAQKMAFEVIISWILIVMANMVGIRAFVLFSILNGWGELGLDKAARIVSSLLGVALTYTALELKIGLIGLAITSLIQALILLLFGKYFIHASISGECVDSKTKFNKTHGRYQKIEKGVAVGKVFQKELANQIGLSILSYIVGYLSVFVIEYQTGPTELAAYNPLLRVAVLICTVASMIPQMLYPHAAKTWSEQNWQAHRKIFRLGLTLGMSAYVIIALSVWTISPIVFPIWLGKENFIGTNVFGAILIFYGLVVFNTTIVSPMIAGAGDYYIQPAILNAILVSVCIVPCIKNFGVIGAPIAMFLGSFPSTIWITNRALRTLKASYQPDQTKRG